MTAPIPLPVQALAGERTSPDAGGFRTGLRSPACVVLLCLALGACASLELEGTPPPGFDLTGTWQLVEDSSDSPPANRRLRARGGMLAFVVQDFPVMRASEMSIQQSRDSMGIRYDGRDYRDVSWGERRRGLWDVRAGWHEGDLYIISDASDADAREILRLSDDGQRLEVEVRVESSGDDVHVTRVFRRR